MKYTFGDTPTADDRLKRIASFFNPLAQTFIRSHLITKTGTAFDLGCGPGYTTNMVYQATNAGNVTGFDISDNFLESAKSYFPDYNFIKHDVANKELPGKADVIYVRFLLSHLENTKKAIQNWTKALNPNGLLFIDELEEIHNSNSLFSVYLDINNKLIHSQGANLFVGNQLERDVTSMNVIYNESTILPVKNNMAAWWFYPNTVSVWKTSDIVKKFISESKREEIAHQMFDMTESNSDESSITWVMKRIIIKKL